MPKPYRSSGAKPVKTASSEAYKSLLSDRHTLVRAGIRALFNRIEEVEVIAEAAHTQQTLALIEEFEPNIVLLNIPVPGLSGLK